MPSDIAIEISNAAASLQRTHPKAPALDVLDLVMQGQSGSLSDFGQAIHPCAPLGQIVAEAFDRGMVPQDWFLVRSPNSPPALVQTLMGIWQVDVLPRFADRYKLTP